MADPGFPVGGAPTRWGAPTSDIYTFRQKHMRKTKEIDPVGEAHAGDAPPGSTNGLYVTMVWIKKTVNGINLDQLSFKISILHCEFYT